jgi:hypothetical protein
MTAISYAVTVLGVLSVVQSTPRNFAYYDALGSHDVADKEYSNSTCRHVYYPTSTPPAGGWPVYHFACGTGALPNVYEATLKHIASHGFVAAASIMDLDNIGVPNAEHCYRSLVSHESAAPVDVSKMVSGGHSGGGPQGVFIAGKHPENYKGYVGQHAAAIPILNRPSNKQLAAVHGPVLQLCGTLDIMPFCGCGNAEKDYYNRYPPSTSKTMIKSPDSHVLGTETETGNKFEGGLVVAFLYHVLNADPDAYTALLEGGSRKGYSVKHSSPMEQIVV